MIIILNGYMDKITTEKLNTPEDYLTIRCPQCLKLYMVHEVQIQTVYPEFTCTGCQCHFAFEYPVPNRDSILTFQVSPTQFDFKKKCPKCDHLQSEKNEICSACGVVIENFLLLKNETYPRVSVDLIKLWNDVLQEFENGYNHELFINQCRSKQKLDYAEFKYKELGRRAGDESMVTPWLEKINPPKYDVNYKEKVIEEQISQAATATTENALPAVLRYALAGYSYLVKHNWFYLMGTLAGILLIVMGISTPGKRNQIGLGIALLLSSVGFYVFRNNPQQKKK